MREDYVKPEFCGGLVGGKFEEVGGYLRTNNIGWWSDHSFPSWHTPAGGTDGPVYALATYASVTPVRELVAGGEFIEAGGARVSNVAAWDGRAWRSLGRGMNGPVHALCEYDGYLFAGGEFTEADGRRATYIAMWDGFNWWPVDMGTDGPVYALTTWRDSNAGREFLVVGGRFSTAGFIRVNNIASFHFAGIPGWQRLDGGTSDAVYALEVYGRDLIAGGAFERAGRAVVNYVANWDGLVWSAMGHGMNDFVYTLETYNSTWLPGLLMAGGSFTEADGTRALRVAVYDPRTVRVWEPLGRGMDDDVLSLYSPAGVIPQNVIAGGRFLSADGRPARGLAIWRFP